MQRNSGSLLGSKRLHDILVGGEIRPLDQIDAVRNRAEDSEQAIANGARLAGQINDQRFAADPSDLSRENRGGHDLERNRPHLRVFFGLPAVQISVARFVTRI